MFRTLLAVAVTAVLVAAVLPAAAQRDRAPTGKPDLVVAAATEPPDYAPPDSDFLVSFTVGNQGRAEARTAFGSTSLARAYLSVGRVLSADDRRRRVGDRRIRPLRPGEEATRRFVASIPATFPRGEYFLIICADVRNVIDEVNDRANCHVSGQRVVVADEHPYVG